jgi:hypothetical protein
MFLLIVIDNFISNYANLSTSSDNVISRDSRDFPALPTTVAVEVDAGAIIIKRNAKWKKTKESLTTSKTHVLESVIKR